MKKFIWLIIVFCFWTTVYAGDLKLEVGLIEPLAVSFGEADEGILRYPYILMCPLIDCHYYFFERDSFVNFGAGLRVMPLVLANIIVTDLVVDFDFGPLLLRTQVGGGLYFLHYATTISAGFRALTAPDISLYYQINEWVSFGGGFLCVFDYHNEPLSMTPSYVGYIGGRFIF